jgi:uncharacterized protein YdaU (DUF1376 family)
MSAPGFIMYPGDYLRDTIGLRTEEHGAYCLLLFHLYAQGGRLKNDPRYLARVTGLTPTKFRKAWAEISRYFFESEDGKTIGHKRVDRELEKQRKLSEVRAAARTGKTKPAKNGKFLNQKRIQTASKNPEKSEEKQAEHGSIDNQLSVTNPIGLVSIPNGIEIPILPPAGADALARLRDAAASTPAAGEEAERLALDVQGFVDGAFIVGGRYSLERFSRSLAKPLAASGLRLALPPPPENVIPLARAS